MTGKPFEANVRRPSAGAAVIDLRGDINATAETALNAAYAEAEAAAPQSLALNFSEVGYINSTGIALIVGVLAKARRGRLPLRVFGLSPHYQEIFQITRLADFMSICADEASAVAEAAR